jgi:hypothetical protein
VENIAGLGRKYLIDQKDSEVYSGQPGRRKNFKKYLTDLTDFHGNLILCKSLPTGKQACHPGKKNHRYKEIKMR